MRRSRSRTYGMTRRVSSPSRSKRNSIKRKLLKRNEMLYLVLRSQPRHGPPDLSDRKGGTALHTMSPLYPPAAHGELLPVEELRQLTYPVVRGGAGLHADQAGRQRCEKLHHLAAAKLLSDDDLLGRIDAVDLKHVLGDIQTDCGN